MISLPRAFCQSCRVAYKPVENGIVLAAKLETGRTYYKVHSDMHECPSCGNRIYAGFGMPIESFNVNFGRIETDQDVQI